MGILEALATLQVQFIRHHKNLMSLFKGKVAQADKSNDAKLLQGIDLTDLMGPAKDALATHAADTNNPHNDRSASLGLHTKAEFDALVGAKIAQGIVPVSTFGELDKDLDLVKAFTASGWILKAGQDIKVVLSGNSFVIKAQQLDLSKLLTTYASQKVLVYLKLKQGKITYSVSITPLAESITTLYIGFLTTGASGITAITLQKVIRIGTFRPFGTPMGSVMPYAGGTRSTPTKLPATWKPS